LKKVVLILLRFGKDCNGADDGVLPVGGYEPAVAVGDSGGSDGSGPFDGEAHHPVDVQVFLELMRAIERSGQASISSTRIGQYAPSRLISGFHR
jgi:hypothetical protein